MNVFKFLPMLALLTIQPAMADGPRATKPELRPKIPQFDITTTVLQFPTGLRVLIQEDHSHPIATIYKYVGHGFNDDPVGAEETAHFVEHTWFRSIHGNMPPIMFMIQDLGTRFNATTASDRTDYRTAANVKYLPILLKLESLRMTDFYRGVTEENVEVEREVIRNEWRRRNEQSTSIVLDYMNEALYPQGHPYARASTHETLNNITLPVLQEYVDTYYKPEDTTITIIGDFETQELISMLLENFELSLFHEGLTEEHLEYRLAPGVEAPPEEDEAAWEALRANPENFRLFARNPDNPDDAEDIAWFLHDTSQPLPSRLPDVRPEPPELGTKELITRKGPVEKKTVMVGWSMPAGYREDAVTMRMVGGYASFEVKRGLNLNYGKDVNTDESGCFAYDQLLATTMLCYAELNNPKLDPEAVAEKMIDQMANIQIPEDQLQRDISSKQYSLAQAQQYVALLDSIDLVAAAFGSRAESIGEWAHWTGNPNYYSEAMKQTNALSFDAIVRTAEKYLKRNRAARVVVEPLEAADIDVASSESSYGGASEGDAVITASDDLSLATRKTIRDSYAQPNLSQLEDVTLPNGMRLVILPHSEAPKVHARLIFGGGTGVEPIGMHSFVARFSQSEGEDPLQIAATPYYYFQPPFLGQGEATAKPLMGFDRFASTESAFSLGITAPSGNLDGAMWILRHEIETLRPSSDGLRSYTKRMYKNLKRNFFEAGWHRRRTQSEQLYGDHNRYRSNTWADIDEAAEWDPADFARYIDDHIHPANATLLVVGNISKEQAAQDALTYFGEWKAASDSALKGRPELIPPQMPTASSRTLIYDDEKRTQTQTTFACRLNSNGDEDRYAVSVLGQLLSNQIFATLRVKEGLAYSPGGGAWTNDDGTAVLYFSSLAVNSGVGRTVEFFRHIVERVESGDIDRDEVKLHKLRMNRSSGVANQSVDQMTGMLAGALMNERTWEDVLKQGDEVAKVNMGDMQRLVEGCMDHHIVQLEGPKDIITEQLDARNFEYEIVDYEALGEELLWAHDKKAAKKRSKAKAKEDAKKAKAEAKEEGEEGEEEASEDETADASEGTEAAG